MTRFAGEIRLAIRTLLKARGLAATAVVTLGVGMTLCTTAMVVVNAYLFSELPYPNADRLYWLRYGAPGQEQPRGMASLDWRALDDVLELPVAWDLDMFYLLGGEHPESAPGAWVTRGFVEALGIRPAIGRGFDDGAFATGGENVAIISHRLWTTRFGGDPGVVGRTFAAYVSDRPHETERFTIVGVLPQNFWHLNPYTDILAPLRAPSYPYMARLRVGVTAASAAARIRGFVAGAATVPDNWAVNVVSAHEAHVTPLRPMLRTAGVAAALVMLVACANVAGLLLVRATRRQREVAVRSALGASRGAIARMLLAEGLVLGGAATLLAVATTWITLRSLAPLLEQQLGRSAPGGLFAFVVDWRALAFATSVGILTAVVCAIVPMAALRAPQLMPSLQRGQRGATESKRTHRMRAVLMIVEVAASLALLVGSAVMLRSVVALMRSDLGISAERVLNASMTLRQTRYPDAASRAAVFDRLAGRVAAISGVESVGLTTAWPLQQPGQTQIDIVDGPSRGIRAGAHRVSDAYFSALAIPVVAGRAFQSTDRIGTEPVAIVSESLARRLWPAGDALGSRVAAAQPQEGSGETVVVRRRVVGIVGDVRQDPADVDRADLYVPMRQDPTRFAFLLVRTAGAPAAAVPALLDAAHDVDPELVVHRARPLQTIVDETTARPRFMTSLLACFALAAAILALVGVYGVIAYAVRQREREIAVRLAVGADPARIVRLFVRQGGAILIVGLAAGVVATLTAGRLVESQLFGVTFRDPIAVATAVIAFGGAGMLAVWWPARRAASTDPAIALRAE
jgi:putative ABC transport system permease protein